MPGQGCPVWFRSSGAVAAGPRLPDHSSRPGTACAGGVEPAPVTAHRAIIEAGPASIRRLCCGTNRVADGEVSETVRQALEAIDDRVALVDGRPVAVPALWRAALRSLHCPNSHAQNATVVV